MANANICLSPEYERLDKYNSLTLAFARYNRMVAIEHERQKRGEFELKAAAWLGIAERLICGGLTNLVRGDSLQFLADRVNDAYWRAGSPHRWNPTNWNWPAL